MNFAFEWGIKTPWIKPVHCVLTMLFYDPGNLSTHLKELFQSAASFKTRSLTVLGQ